MHALSCVFVKTKRGILCEMNREKHLQCVGVCVFGRRLAREASSAAVCSPCDAPCMDIHVRASKAHSPSTSETSTSSRRPFPPAALSYLAESADIASDPSTSLGACALLPSVIHGFVGFLAAVHKQHVSHPYRDFGRLRKSRLLHRAYTIAVRCFVGFDEVMNTSLFIPVKCFLSFILHIRFFIL